MPTNLLVRSLTRRAWVQRSSMGIATLLLVPPVSGDEQPLDSTIRSMASLTGNNLGDPWLHPTAELVAIILADSQPLRALELGSIEPATTFKAD